jgi:hypothetical protein
LAKFGKAATADALARAATLYKPPSICTNGEAAEQRRRYTSSNLWEHAR